MLRPLSRDRGKFLNIIKRSCQKYYIGWLRSVEERRNNNWVLGIMHACMHIPSPHLLLSDEALRYLLSRKSATEFGRGGRREGWVEEGGVGILRW